MFFRKLRVSEGSEGFLLVVRGVLQLEVKATLVTSREKYIPMATRQLAGVASGEKPSDVPLKGSPNYSIH